MADDVSCGDTVKMTAQRTDS